jgi:hypothetical protein
LRVRGEPWGYGSHSAQPGTYELDPRGMAPYTTQGYGGVLAAGGMGSMTLLAAAVPALTGYAFWQLSKKKGVTPWVAQGVSIANWILAGAVVLGGGAATAVAAAN